MNIELETIDEVLAMYNLNGQVSKIRYFIQYYDEQSSEVKIICKVEFADREPLVMKFVREKEHPSQKIESQSVFSECLRDHGILTPRRYVSDGKYCRIYSLNHLEVAVTIEDYLGEEIKEIDFLLAHKIGQLIGKIHRISESGNCLIGNDTIFNLVGYNEVSGYNAFRELGEAGAIDARMFQKITELYTQKLEKIKLSWSKLPRFATQGDISINNLTCFEEKIGMFDYNIAGDETLVGDMVLEGLLTAFEMDLAAGLTGNDRESLFAHYYIGYLTERPLTDDEKAVVGDVFSIASAFWFTKIKYNDDSLEMLVERQEYNKVSVLLEEIYAALYEDAYELVEGKNS